MEADRTRPLDWDPLGDATRERAEIKMTGAQLMDLIEERDAAIADAAATRSALRQLAEQEPIVGDGGWYECGYCEVEAQTTHAFPHRPDCVWLAARLLVSDVSTPKDATPRETT